MEPQHALPRARKRAGESTARRGPDTRANKKLVHILQGLLSLTCAVSPGFLPDGDLLAGFVPGPRSTCPSYRAGFFLPLWKQSSAQCRGQKMCSDPKFDAEVRKCALTPNLPCKRAPGRGFELDQSYVAMSWAAVRPRRCTPAASARSARAVGGDRCRVVRASASMRTPSGRRAGPGSTRVANIHSTG